MALITLHQVELAFGGANVLNKIDLSLEQGQRLCLIGRNGEGKSTLLRLLAGQSQADAGQVIYQQGMRLAMLEQDVPMSTGKIKEIVAQGLGNIGKWLNDFEVASEACALGDMAACHAMQEAQENLDHVQGWSMSHATASILAQMQLDGDADLSSLSGGRKRRVLLARALVSNPDILLLDEPTNHLDVQSIEWLEQFLLAQPNLSLLFVSHDRAFVDRMATHILELDRGTLRRYEGNYARYQEIKAQQLLVEEKTNSEFDKKLALEEVWIRQGIKARRTRNEGRVRALEALRLERAARRDKVGRVNMAVQESTASGKLVFDIQQLQVGYGDTTLVKQFSTTVMRGDRIAMIGDNGTGKTTLLKTILGELKPMAGHIKTGTQLDIVYFDQLRNQLDLEKSVQENVTDGSDFVEVNGKKKHIISLLQDFLFTPERARTPVKALSGGERNRLLLAKIFLTPSNLMVLDEPTNDLDMDTLELLEEVVSEYTGTLILISHDRAFVDSVATTTWVFDGKGGLAEYVGGYSDYMRQVKSVHSKQAKGAAANSTSTNTQIPNIPAVPSNSKISKAGKLSYKDQRELEQMPTQIAEAEQELATCHSKLADGSLYVADPSQAATIAARISTLDDLIISKLERWETLEAMQKGQ